MHVYYSKLIAIYAFDSQPRQCLYSKGDEPICSPGPLCQLPLSRRAAQLFSHNVKPVKNEKIIHQQKRTTNESNKNSCEPYS